MTTGSLSDLAQLQDEIITMKAEAERRQKEVDEYKAELAQKKSRLLAILLEAKLDSFKTSRGLISVTRRFSVKVPKGDDLANFLGHLEAQRPGDYLALRTVNSQTLNAWYKAEVEAAKERGEFGVSLPGLGEPTISEDLSIRSA